MGQYTMEIEIGDKKKNIRVTKDSVYKSGQFVIAGGEWRIDMYAVDWNSAIIKPGDVRAIEKENVH